MKVNKNDYISFSSFKEGTKQSHMSLSLLLPTHELEYLTVWHHCLSNAYIAVAG